MSEFIEPPIRLKYQRVPLGGKSVGVYVLDNCQDRPYMMRMDQSEKLRRGDAYVRRQDACVKMGRHQLQELFERKIRDSVSGDRLEIGFPGEIIHKDFRILTADLSRLPSALAGAKLTQLIDVQSLTLTLPRHDALHMASRLPKKMINGEFVDRGANELADYPAVNQQDDLVNVSTTLGEIPPLEPVTVYRTPVRICVGTALRGRKIGIRYSLFGRNLREPAKGQLRLLF